MVRYLNENERIIPAGKAVFRAPDGTPPPTEPLYRIGNADEANPACVVELKDNERLVLAGTMLNDLKLARERINYVVAVGCTR